MTMLNATEVALLANVSPQAVTKAIRDGRLKAAEKGVNRKHHMISQADALAFAEAVEERRKAKKAKAAERKKMLAKRRQRRAEVERKIGGGKP